MHVRGEDGDEEQYKPYSHPGSCERKEEPDPTEGLEHAAQIDELSVGGQIGGHDPGVKLRVQKVVHTREQEEDREGEDRYAPPKTRRGPKAGLQRRFTQ